MSFLDSEIGTLGADLNPSAYEQYVTAYRYLYALGPDEFMATVRHLFTNPHDHIIPGYRLPAIDNCTGTDKYALPPCHSPPDTSHAVFPDPNTDVGAAEFFTDGA